jgi:hypothetical protein
MWGDRHPAVMGVMRWVRTLKSRAIGLAKSIKDERRDFDSARLGEAHPWGRSTNALSAT